MKTSIKIFFRINHRIPYSPSEAAPFQRLLPTFYHPERRKQDYEYNLYLSIIGEKTTQTDGSYLTDIALLNETKQQQLPHKATIDIKAVLKNSSKFPNLRHKMSFLVKHSNFG